MIDRPARDRAAGLIRDFRDGGIDNDRFAGGFPVKSDDRAIRAIRTMLYYAYDDLHRHKLAGKHALTPEAKARFNRCIAFLESDEEYAWPMDDFVGPVMKAFSWLAGLCVGVALAGYTIWPFIIPQNHAPWRDVKEMGLLSGAAVGLCLWVVWFFVQRHRNLKAEARRPQFDGDDDAWPFTSTEQAARHTADPAQP